MAAGIDGARSAPELRPHGRGPGGALEGAARLRRGEPGAPPDLRGRRAHDLRTASPHRDRRPSLMRGVSGHAHGRADGRSRPHPHRNRPRGQHALVVGRRRGPPGPVRSSRHHLPTGDRRTRSGGGAQAGRAGHLLRRPRAGGVVGARQGDRGDASRTRRPPPLRGNRGRGGRGRSARRPLPLSRWGPRPERFGLSRAGRGRPQSGRHERPGLASLPAQRARAGRPLLG